MNNTKKICCIVVGFLISKQIVNYVYYKKEMKKQDELSRIIEENGMILDKIVKDSSKKLQEDTKKLMDRMRYRIFIEDKTNTEPLIIDNRLFETFGEALDCEMELYKIYSPSRYYIQIDHVFIPEAE